MRKVDVLTYLLVFVALAAGLNFVANRASFFDVSNAISSIKKISKKSDVSISSVGYLDDFAVTCGTSATKVQPPAGAAQSIACKCASDVSWGSSTVASGTYESSDWGGNVRFAYCRAASATACNCIALVTSAQ